MATLSVPDVAGSGREQDRADCRVDERIGHTDVDHGFLRELHADCRALIRLLDVTFAAMALHAGDSETADLRLEECLEHRVHSVRTNNCFDEFHGILIDLR